VLKDDDSISSYKISVSFLKLGVLFKLMMQTGHTIHMVKGAAKAAEAPAAAAPLPQMGTGLNVSGNPVDNVENIHHVSPFSPHEDEADK
jgi:ubiquilin